MIIKQALKDSFKPEGNNFNSQKGGASSGQRAYSTRRTARTKGMTAGGRIRQKETR